MSQTMTVREMLTKYLQPFARANDDESHISQSIHNMYRLLNERAAECVVEIKEDASLSDVGDAIKALNFSQNLSSEWYKRDLDRGISALHSKHRAEQSSSSKTLGQLDAIHTV